MSNTTCFYHGSDDDGRCSAALVKLKYPEARLYPVTYSVLSKEHQYLIGKIQENNTIIICDFCFSMEAIKWMQEDMRCNVIVLDHHITTIKKIKESGLSIQGIRNVEKSGCELTWQYFYDSKSINHIVYLIGRWDVWKHHEDEDIVPFHYGMGQLNTDPINNMALWTILLTDNDSLVLKYKKQMIQEILNNGNVILQYTEQENSYRSKGAFCCTLKGFENIRLVCIFGGYGSFTFKSIWNPEWFDAMMTANYDGEKWSCSIYTDKEDVDVSIVAESFGGGGHRGACGFITTDVFSVMNVGKRVKNGSAPNVGE